MRDHLGQIGHGPDNRLGTADLHSHLFAPKGPRSFLFAPEGPSSHSPTRKRGDCTHPEKPSPRRGRLPNRGRKPSKKSRTITYTVHASKLVNREGPLATTGIRLKKCNNGDIQNSPACKTVGQRRYANRGWPRTKKRTANVSQLSQRVARNDC